MTRKIIAIPGLGWQPPEPSEEAAPLAYLSPLAEMAALAAALKQGSTATLEALVRDRRRLQQAATDELHRLVGRTITEVALATGLREKIGRAVAEGGALMAARPPDHVIAQVEDPSAFVDRCAAACAAVKLFLTAELERSLAAAGMPEVENPADWVQQAAEELHLALVSEAASDLERKADLALAIGEGLGLAEPPAAPVRLSRG